MDTGYGLGGRLAINGTFYGSKADGLWPLLFTDGILPLF